MMKRRSESGDSAAQAIPITVRQLEAVIRLSESLARMDLQLYANVDHVKEALRLFKVATLQAASAPFSDSAGNPEFDKKTKAAEQWFLVRVSQGSELPTKQLLRDAVAMGHDENASRKALHNLVLRNTFSFLQQRRVVRRIGQ
jgi:DNA replication licensing factor MCM5